MKMSLRRIIIGVIELFAPFYRFFYRKTKPFQHLLIQTNNICTRKCSWCVYGISQNIEKVALPESVFRKVIDELADMDYSGRVSLFETNEPLTDDRIFNFIKYASVRLPRAWHFLNTNGDLLTQEKVKKLFESGLDTLDISSYDTKSYDKIEGMLQKIKEYKTKIRHFNKSRKEFLTDNRGGNLNAIFETKTKKLFCDRINKILFIKPSGDVVSCFGDFFNVNIMGNVNDNSLKEIWWGKEFERLREHLNKCDRTLSPLCKECNYVGFRGYYQIPFIKGIKKRLKGKK